MDREEVVEQADRRVVTLRELHRHMLPASELYDGGEFEASLLEICRTAPMLESLIAAENDVAAFRDEIATIVATADASLHRVRVEMGWFAPPAQVDRVLASTIPFVDVCELAVVSVLRSAPGERTSPILGSLYGFASLVTQVAIFGFDRPAERRSAELAMSAALTCHRRVHDRVLRSSVASHVDPSLFEWTELLEARYPGAVSAADSLRDPAAAAWPSYDELGPRTGLPHAWHPDPTGRHEQRFWAGAWTDEVVDGGETARDPYESEAAPASTGRLTRLMLAELMQ